MPGLGDEFRANREARHLSLSDVSEQIHIRSVYLQSIEEEEWSAIAAPVYVRGFVRTYARFLGMDPEFAVERVNAAMGTQTAASRAPEPSAEKSMRNRARAKTAKSPSPWLWLAGLVAIALVAVVGFKAYDYYQQSGTEDASGAVAVASPEPSPSASPSASPSPTPSASPKAPLKVAQTLVLSVTQRSWLLVKIDGAQEAEGIYPPGTVKRFHGKSANIRAGNAGGVHLTVNGKDLGALGASGSVVDKTIHLAEE
jgi:cytoskeletal protein RodZ